MSFSSHRDLLLGDVLGDDHDAPGLLTITQALYPTVGAIEDGPQRWPARMHEAVLANQPAHHPYNDILFEKDLHAGLKQTSALVQGNTHPMISGMDEIALNFLIS